MSSIKLNKFDIGSIPDDATICLCAKRNSGKSWMIRDLMYHKRDFPAGMVLAPTDRMTEFYTKFIPSVFVHYDYKTELLTNLFLRQTYLSDKNKDREKSGKKEIDPRAFLIMDDCLSSKGEWAKDPNIAEIFYNGRHRKIMFLLSMQFPLGLKPELRGNFDYIFLLSEDFISNQKRLYEHYAGMFPSFEIFRKVFTEVTDNFGVMVINNKSRSKLIQDKVFWYKAVNPGSFMVGGRTFSNYHKRHFDPQWNKKKAPFDVCDYLKKKNRVIVDVELGDTPRRTIEAKKESTRHDASYEWRPAR